MVPRHHLCKVQGLWRPNRAHGKRSAQLWRSYCGRLRLDGRSSCHAVPIRAVNLCARGDQRLQQPDDHLLLRVCAAVGAAAAAERAAAGAAAAERAAADAAAAGAAAAEPSAAEPAAGPPAAEPPPVCYEVMTTPRGEARNGRHGGGPVRDAGMETIRRETDCNAAYDFFVAMQTGCPKLRPAARHQWRRRGAGYGPVKYQVRALGARRKSVAARLLVQGHRRIRH